MEGKKKNVKILQSQNNFMSRMIRVNQMRTKRYYLFNNLLEFFSFFYSKNGLKDLFPYNLSLIQFCKQAYFVKWLQTLLLFKKNVSTHLIFLFLLDIKIHSRIDLFLYVLSNFSFQFLFKIKSLQLFLFYFFKPLFWTSLH